MRFAKGSSVVGLKYGSQSFSASFGFRESDLILPGSGFVGSTSRSDVDGGVEYDTASTSTSMMHWAQPPKLVAGSEYGETIELAVVADHYNGIEKIGFIADGGAEFFVTSPSVDADGIETYKARLDMSGKSPGETVEIRAIGYPYHGRPRILQGDIQADSSVADTRKQGFFSCHVTKISGIETHNLTAGTTGLLDYIAGLGDISADTVQHRVLITAGVVESGTRTAITEGNMPEWIPLIIEGTGSRATEIDNSSNYGGFGCWTSGAFHFKNLTWYVTCVPVRPRSISHTPWFFFENCSLTADAQPVPSGFTYTDSDGAQIAIVGNAENKTVSRLVYERAYREHGYKAQVVSIGGDKTYGAFMKGCTIGWELGDTFVWCRDCESINNAYDSFHGGCMLGLDVQSAQFGHNRIYVLTSDVLVWQAGVDFEPGDSILVEYEPGTWRNFVQVYSGGTVNQKLFDIYDAEGNTVWRDNWPHCDAWQGRVDNDGSNTFENIWLENLYTDTDSVCQPIINRVSETAIDCMFKGWRIQNTTVFANSYLSQWHMHSDHWIVKNCKWWTEGSMDVERSGELQIRWIDSTDRGWGNTNQAGSTIGCRNAKWVDSTIPSLRLAGSWPTPYPTTLEEFETFINGYAPGWQLDIDAYTKANGYMWINPPE